MKIQHIIEVISKNRLIKDLGWEYKCKECGQGDVWKGKKLTLELDHINGINNDHRLENLRFLCPNCHTQMPTNKGANVKRKIYKCTDCNKKIIKGQLDVVLVHLKNLIKEK